MADEITIDFTLSYEDSEDTDAFLQLVESLASVTTKRVVRAKQNIGTSEEAIGLGDVSSLGWAAFLNRDATNFIELRVGTGGTKFAKLPPGKGCVLFLGSGITAPYAIADTAACQLDYLICSQ